MTVTYLPNVLGVGDEAARQNFEFIESNFQGQIPVVTALPAASNAQDGQEIYYVADATRGVVWRFRYRAASASSFKWEFVGGSSLLAESSTNEVSTGSAVYVAVASALSLTLPLGGDYDVTAYTNQCFSDTASQYGFLSYSFGLTGAVDTDAAVFRAAGANNDAKTLSMTRTKVGATAGIILAMQVRVTAGLFYPTGNGANPHGLRAIPIRVG